MGITTVHKAALHSAGEQYLVNILNERSQLFRFLLQSAFTLYIKVMVIAGIQLHRFRIKLEVVTDNDSRIVEFQSLRGVNTADLLKASRIDGPCRRNVAAIPRHAEIMFFDRDIRDIASIVAFLNRGPFPCKACRSVHSLVVDRLLQDVQILVDPHTFEAL